MQDKHYPADNRNPPAVIADIAEIQTCIMPLRQVQVMLDFDLAKLYGVETRVLNQAVKRNIERFPERFRFQLSKEEMNELVTNCDKFGNKKHYPGTAAAFTEQGVAMLATVLKSPIAVETSIRIMDAFVAMRRMLSSIAPVMSRLDAVERRQITDQSKNDANQAKNESRFKEIFDAMRSKDFPPQKIFFDGMVYDAFEQVRKFVRTAKSELILIDPYADDSVLDILANKRAGVKLLIAKGPRSRLHQTAIDRFNAQYASSLTVLNTDRFHDRFFILDRASLIHIGMSLIHLGKKCFGFSTFDKANIPEFLTRLGL